jgi:hypothetical protein
MAALRNLAISILRLTGHTNIARALRHPSSTVGRCMRAGGLASVLVSGPECCQVVAVRRVP